MVWSAMIALVFMTGAGLQASDAMKSIVSSYLEVHARLFRDNLDGVKSAAGAIGQQATRMGTGGTAIAKAAAALEQAKDLNAAREAFGSLSDAVIAAGNAEGWKDVPDVREAYCPMAKKSWLQKEAGIRNPYFGPGMPTCGSFKESSRKP
jgi:Cu(I)/Ag(I) efflux system membrane fusion protein